MEEFTIEKLHEQINTFLEQNPAYTPAGIVRLINIGLTYGKYLEAEIELDALKDQIKANKEQQMQEATKQ